MEVDIYQILLFLHLLCFVYWLGGDLGVYYSSGILIRPGLSKEARTYVLKIMHWLDQFPRVCMPLVIALGFTMMQMRWFDFPQVYLLPIWCLAITWIGFVITIFLNDKNPEKVHYIKKIDLIMRWSIASSVVVFALVSFNTAPEMWLSAKLLIWAATVFCGISSRLTMKPFGAAFARVMTTGETAEDIAQLKKALYITRIPIFCIWGLVALAGAIGLWKPF
jgi:hypothetical protein